MNLKIGELKQILKSCGIITIKDNNIKFVISTPDHWGNYNWAMFRLENSLLINYFAEIYVDTFNKHQNNMYYWS